MINAAIVGGGGYTAGELIRLLLNHPHINLKWVHSDSQTGLPVCSVHAGLLGDTDLVFTDQICLEDIEVLFLCMGHGKSRDFWSKTALPDNLTVIDLAQDFRDESCGYCYGLPEYQHEKIASSRLIANPGCFATAIQLALLPLAQAGLLTSEVHVTGITGSTGAGIKPGSTTHFSWRCDNLSVYKAFEHQHLLEIERTLTALQGAPLAGINFVPMRGDFTRGIFASVYTDCPLDESQARQLYNDYYSDAVFTHVSHVDIDLKQVTNTNKALLHVSKHRGKILIVSCIDNLLKGAVGQAVQNMNIAIGFREDCGLRLKPNAF